MSQIGEMPEWARTLVEEKTPYLASDPELTIVQVWGWGDCVSFRSRGFVYTADRNRQQVV